jgi:hypothetical protein
MRESCFCGRRGELQDREPVLDAGGRWLLRCPTCGHLDDLEWLTEEAGLMLWGEARSLRVFASKVPRGWRIGAVELEDGPRDLYLVRLLPPLPPFVDQEAKLGLVVGALARRAHVEHRRGRREGLIEPAAVALAILPARA